MLKIALVALLATAYVPVLPSRTGEQGDVARRSLRVPLVVITGDSARAEESGRPSRSLWMGMPAPPLADAERTRYRHAAELAWRFVDRNYVEATGLVSALDVYPHVTMWDVGSTLAALHCAHGLGLLSDSEFERRLRRLLATLGELDLFDGTAFNRSYGTEHGRMVDRKDRVSARGYGWSAMDLGRLLIWLRIVGVHHPDFLPELESVVQRLSFERLVRQGYLWGGDLRKRGVRTYQEGRIGYEQYAASGFALWGHLPLKALDLSANSVPVEVLGVPLLRDRRGHDRLTSEPFLLLGLELGWTPEMRGLARRVLEAQERRYRTSGVVTAVSEDAIALPPHFFYYYSVYNDGRAFTIDVQTPGTGHLDQPRTVSTKAAYAWHALLPSDYTELLVESVEAARGPTGWAAAVFESDGSSAGTENINTQAVILEAALYLERGLPLIYKVESAASS